MSPDCDKIKTSIDSLNQQIDDVMNAIRTAEADGIKTDPLKQQLRQLQDQKRGEALAYQRCLELQHARQEGLSLSFVIVTLLYAPPGKNSEVSYGTGSTTGSRFTVTSSSLSGYQIGESFGGQGEDSGDKGAIVGSGSIAVSVGTSDGQSFEIKKTTSSTVGMQSVADAIDHKKDQIYLWTNAELDLSQLGPGPIVAALRGQNSSDMIVVPVTTEELLDLSKLPDYKRTALAKLTPQDYKALLAVNPWASGGGLDTKRYVPISTSVQLDGPDHANDPIGFNQFDVSTEGVEGLIHGAIEKTSLSATITATAVLEGIAFGFSVGASMQQDYQTQTVTTTGSSQKATVKLKTSTVGYHDVIDIYFDTLFGSFAFVSVAPAGGFRPSETVVVGSLTSAGAPAANKRVDVTFANGRQRIVWTNAKGQYRLFAVPNGPLTVKVGGQKWQSVYEGRPLELTHKLVANP